MFVFKLGGNKIGVQCDKCGSGRIKIGEMTYSKGHMECRGVECLDCGNKCPHYPPAVEHKVFTGCRFG